MEDKKSNIPESLLSKLYDRTGYNGGGNKGFLIFYVDGAGDPVCMDKFENNATRMAVKSGVENFIRSEKEQESFELDFELDD